jgi:hypothetical protein
MQSPAMCLCPFTFLFAILCDVLMRMLLGTTDTHKTRRRATFGAADAQDDLLLHTIYC